MFKCDLCREQLAKGEQPYCINSCPKKAMIIGKREAIFAEARKRASAIHGHLYGMDENGGTSTIYVSPVPFESIDKAIVAKAKAQKIKKPTRMNNPENMLAKHKNWAIASLAAPALGAVAAFVATSRKEGNND